MLEPMCAAVGNQNGGTLSTVLIGKIHVVCQTKAEKLFARHCGKTVLGSDGEGHTQKDNLPHSYSSCATKDSFWVLFHKRELDSDGDGDTMPALGMRTMNDGRPPLFHTDAAPVLITCCKIWDIINRALPGLH